MNADAMCECGHTLSFHWGEEGSCHMGKNGKMINVHAMTRYRDNCREFKPDNLRYLEEIARKREVDNDASRNKRL